MSSIISAAKAMQNPAEYYYRVICSCWSITGKPQVMIFSKKEYYEHKRKYVVDIWKGSEYEVRINRLRMGLHIL